jgi:hypothetical protein
MSKHATTREESNGFHRWVYGVPFDMTKGDHLICKPSKGAFDEKKTLGA